MMVTGNSVRPRDHWSLKPDTLPPRFTRSPHVVHERSKLRLFDPRAVAQLINPVSLCSHGTLEGSGDIRSDDRGLGLTSIPYGLDFLLLSFLREDHGFPNLCAVGHVGGCVVILRTFLYIENKTTSVDSSRKISGKHI